MDEIYNYERRTTSLDRPYEKLVFAEYPQDCWRLFVKCKSPGFGFGLTVGFGFGLTVEEVEDLANTLIGWANKKRTWLENQNKEEPTTK